MSAATTGGMTVRMAPRRQGTKKRKRLPDEQEAEVELFERGWVPAKRKGHWTHARLIGTWTVYDALRLQDETDGGMMDRAHRLLRGKL